MEKARKGKSLLVWLPIAGAVVFTSISGYMIYKIVDNNNKNKFQSFESRKYYSQEEFDAADLLDKNFVAYFDPDTTITFYSYKINDGEPFLDKEGLKELANYFKKIATFGPEVKMLNSIILDNRDIIGKNTLGQYVLQTREIYINTSTYDKLAGSGVTNTEKVKMIMPTLFHEYMHHWAGCYASTGLPKEYDSRNIEDILYKPSGYDSSPQIWNKYFVNNFKNILNYDKEPFNGTSKTEYYPKEVNEKSPYGTVAIQNYMNLKNIFDYSNYGESLNKKFITQKPFSNFKEGTKFAFNPQSQSYYRFSEPNQLSYFYSMTELVPREWTKAAFISPFKITSKQITQPTGITKTVYSDNAITKNYKDNSGRKYTAGAFGALVENPSFNQFSIKNEQFINQINIFNSNVNKFYHDSSPVEKFYDGKKEYQYSTNSLIEDWRRTTETTFRFADKKISLNDTTFYPNNVFGGYYSSHSGDKPLTNKSKEFLNLYLEIMGYGKLISQIIPRFDKFSWIDSNSINSNADMLNEFKILGYVPNKKFKALYYTNNSNQLIKVPLELLQINNKDIASTFRIKKEPIVGLYDDDFESKVLNPDIHHMLGGTDIYSYSTKYINYKNIKSQSEIFFWEDKNNDNVMTDEEKIYNVALPNHRSVSSFSGRNYEDYLSGNKSIQYKIVESSNGKAIFEKEAVWKKK